MRELPQDERTRLGLAAGARGAVVEWISPGGAADVGTLRVGDVIVDFDGQAIERATRLQWLASTAGVGKVVTLGVDRHGDGADAGADRVSLRVTLGELDEPHKTPRAKPAP